MEGVIKTRLATDLVTAQGGKIPPMTSIEVPYLSCSGGLHEKHLALLEYPIACLLRCVPNRHF